MRRILLCVALALLPSPVAAQADHLQCFKIKDTTTKTTYTATLTPSDPNFPASTGCTIRVPARLLCVDVVKSNVVPPPQVVPPGAPTHKFLCYKVKCAKASPTATVQDQFGTHNVTVKSTSLLCAPVPVPTTTTTSSTSTTSTSTTQPGSCQTNGQCPGAPNATGLCQGGMCTISCNSGFANCKLNNADGCEVSTQNSVSNCGSCGLMCPTPPNSTPFCTMAMCGITCNSPFLNCDGMNGNGCEVNPTSDANNCGSCGTVCPPAQNTTPMCSSSQCTFVCNSGFANCDNLPGNGCEVNTTNNNMNCGACGVVCGGGTPNCVGGTCSP
jgi:hypothetical protein